MANLQTTKFVDLDMLKKYHEGVVDLIDANIDETSLHTVALDEENHVIKFYVEGSSEITTSTSAAFTVDISDIYDNVGDLSSIEVETAAGVKATNLVAAINKLASDLDDAEAAAVVTIKTDVTTEGALKTYTFYQGGEEETNKIGKIDIPKDFLVKSGSLVENPDEDHQEGKYIALVINTVGGDATDSTIYIKVTDLVDVYTAAENASQVQVAISSDSVVSATLVENGIAATADAETGLLSSTPLDDNIVGALNKAITAVQASDIQIAVAKDITDIFEPAAGAQE